MCQYLSFGEASGFGHPIALAGEDSMIDTIERLFRDFDNGRISRRELLRALGLSLLAVPSIGLAQGGDSTAGRGRGRGNRAPADTTHAAAPFDSTGWRTVWFDHLTYQCGDYTKAVPFYAAVMGWKVRSDDGKRCVMEIGPDVGDAVFINGYVPRHRPAHRRPPTHRRQPTPAVAEVVDAAAATDRRVWRPSRTSRGESSRGTPARSKRSSKSAG